MPVVPPSRLEQFVIKQWYKADRAMHDPVLKWLEANPQAAQGIEKFCNRLLQEKSNEAVLNSVPTRSMEVKVTVNVAKAAADFYSKVPPQAKEGISLEMVRTAVEMALEEAGYPVVNHLLEFEIEVPTPEELEAARLEAAERQAQARAAAEAAKQQLTSGAAPQLGADDIEDDLDDDEGLDDDGSNEEEEEDDENMFLGDDDEDEEVIEGLAAGQVHGNGKGLLRRVDAIEEDKVAWTVVQGQGSTPTGKTGKTSIASFEKWSQEVVEFEATALPA